MLFLFLESLLLTVIVPLVHLDSGKVKPIAYPDLFLVIPVVILLKLLLQNFNFRLFQSLSGFLVLLCGA